MVTDQRRRIGAAVVLAALVVAGATACTGASEETTTDAAQPSQSRATTGTVPTFRSRSLGYLDLTTGDTSMTDLIPSNSAVDVSPIDGSQIAYVQDGVVMIAVLDGPSVSGVQIFEGTRGDPTGPQWSPDGSHIVYQDGGGLFVVDVASDEVLRIADLEGVAKANLSYASPTVDPTGTTVMFTMPNFVGDRERYDLWSVPVTGGEPTLVRKGASFGDYSPDGTQLAFVEDGGFGDLFVAPTAGGKAQRLAAGEIVVPRWSPDGTRIAYNDGAGKVYVVDVETGERTLVVESDHLPAWVDDDTLSLSP